MMEVERSNQKYKTILSNQKKREVRHMKQNFCVNQQGPSHGPEWKRVRPHTLIYNHPKNDCSTTIRKSGDYNMSGLVEQPSG